MTQKALTIPEVMPRRTLPRLATSPKPGPLEIQEVQIIYLDEIAGRLEELGELLATLTRLAERMDRAPAGRARPFQLAITGSTIVEWKVKSPSLVGRPCTAATIFNDGPDAVWIALNEIRDGFQQVNMGEAYPIDFHGHALIEDLFFYSTDGGTANLRIPLEY